MWITSTSSFKSFLIEQLLKSDYGIDCVQENLGHELIFRFMPRIHVTNFKVILLNCYEHFFLGFFGHYKMKYNLIPL